MPADPRFTELVSLACHDLRTPLATVSGFASTLLRLGGLDEQRERYIGLIDAAAVQLGEITDELSLAARIAGGRLEAVAEIHPTAELARAAAESLEAGRAEMVGDRDGGSVCVDRDAAVRALAGVGRAALRHGGLDSVVFRASGASIAVAPLAEAAAPVVLGDEVRDLGAAVGRAVIEALGGELARHGDELVVKFPAA